MKAIIFIFLFTQLNFAHALELKGTASSTSSQQLIYTEEHSIETDNSGFYKKVKSVYKDTEGHTIAKMTSDFSKDIMVPEIHFEDYRFKKIESLTYENDQSLKFEIQEEGKPKKTKSIKKSDKMVAGQGFDNFVKKNFEDLQKRNIPLNFGVLASMSFYNFKGYAINPDENDNITKFGISLSNPVLRLFVKELVIEYDSKEKVIKSYRGLSNFPDSKGKSQIVHIKYETINE